MINYLLSQGVDVNVRKGLPLLTACKLIEKQHIYAFKNGPFEMANFLIHHGANPQLLTRRRLKNFISKESVYNGTSKSYLSDIIQFLKSKGWK